MRLKVASRKSDLARWQAVQVARALERLPEKPSIEFIFKSSLGDQDLDMPLASMGSKGVFTEDFYGDLVSGQCDVVVHSWKDLPVEERAETHIALTLPRADVRDVLLVPETVWQTARKTGSLKILTSSPRRMYNAAQALPLLLPAQLHLEFVTVRGNVPTRLIKMHDEGAALIVAKAGLDRLLEAESEGFLAQDVTVKPLIETCRFQILPVSMNPPAAAQGALAVEVSRDREALNSMCGSLTDERTFACVQRERDILKGYGGGCHQRIGVAVLPREYGMVYALKGITDHGEVLSQWRVENKTPWEKAKNEDQVFPREAQENSWFDREPIDVNTDLLSRGALMIARADALPARFRPNDKQLVWTAGVQTWGKLAKLGVWVNGTDDGLGESEPKHLDYLAPDVRLTKLSHKDSGGANTVATYQLKAKREHPDLRGKTHFFWMSRTSFERARELFPREIQSGRHGCGPGTTYEFLKRQKALDHPVKVFAGLEQFLRESLP